MSATLGLDDDLDPVELQEALEASFGVRFSVAEVADVMTVGDLFHVIRRRLGRPKNGRAGCATAMAFYRLRRTFRELGTPLPLRPDTRIRTLRSLSPRRLLRTLSRHTGLRVPRWRSTLVGQIGGWTIAAALAWLLLTAVTFPSLWFEAVLAGAFGVSLTCIDPGRLPPGCETLGGLARTVAGLNFSDFCAQGAGARDKDIWVALLEVISEFTHLPQTGIRPETLILHGQSRAA